jgi:hypothetical protein
VANMLALLDIRRAKDLDGKELKVQIKYYGGTATCVIFLTQGKDILIIDIGSQMSFR